MSLKRLAWLFAVVLVLAVSAKADGMNATVYFNGGYAFANGGYGIPPYQGTMTYQGTVTAIPTEFFCVDFSHEISGGQSWNATVTGLTDTAGISSSTYLKNPTDYLDFAWLTMELMSAENAKNLTKAAGYQWEIWSFTDGGDPSKIPSADLPPAWFTGQGWEILTPTGNGGGQEFLVQTPEPSSLLLFGTAFLVLLGFATKKISA